MAVEVVETIKQRSLMAEKLFSAISKVIVGQKLLQRRLVTALITDGHILLEGVPGLAKTLSIKALAGAIDATFHRIQFTPDLLPADIVGTEIFQPHTGAFVVRQGPVFANFILADEINRAPAKVQSALLETMQERQVTIGEKTFKMPLPFLVLATQNPIEQEGTYPLPEAQVDRFMMKVRVDYPTLEEERQILELVTTTEHLESRIQKVISLEEIAEIAEACHLVYVDEKIRKYIVDLVFATRKPADYGLKNLSSLIELGASPRASISLFLAARAEAMLSGNHFVLPQHVKTVAYDVLRHRLMPTFEAEAQGLSCDDIVKLILDGIAVP
jgi:MoxR-like ATPase